jgi:hypothetical protein
MNRKTTIQILVAVLVVLASGLYLLNPQTSEAPDRLWIPALSEPNAELLSITIEKGESSTELVNQGGQWQVTNRLGYPAKLGAMIDLVSALRSAKIMERKTANPDHHAELQLTESGAEATRATRIRLELAEDRVVLLGQTASQREATFVRSPDDNQVWLVSGKITASASPNDWLSPVLFDIPETGVLSVTIKHPASRESYTLVRDADALNWSLAESPTGLTLKYSSILNQIPSRLAQFKLLDVADRPASSVEATSVIEVALRDGRIVALDLVEEDERYWLTAEVKPVPLAQELAPTVQSDNGETVNVSSVASVDLGLSVSEAVLEDLRFEISASNFATLTKVRSDYFDTQSED